MIATTTPAVFEKTVRAEGEQVAMRYKELGLWHDISWRRYYDTARNIGAALMDMGLEKGMSAAVIGDNCPEWVMIDMGIQCAGGVSVGL